MRKFQKLAIRGFVVYASTFLLLISLLYLTSFIPKEAIQRQVRSSAMKWNEEGTFYPLIENFKCSVIDNYADSILFQIMYQIGDDKIASLVSASYYKGSSMNTIESLLYSTENEVTSNIDYDRYWHGMMIFLRPLLVFFDITGIRILAGILLAVLLIHFLYVLWKRDLKAELTSFVTGFIAVSGFIVPFCIEYMITWFLMLFSTLFLLRWEKEKPERICAICIVSGVCTAFFDFLTTETLVITVPLLFLLCIREKEGRQKRFCRQLAELALYIGLWGISYAAMWSSKWVIASLVMRENRILPALMQTVTRLNARIATIHFSPWIEALFQNIADLVIFEGTNTYLHIVAALLVISFCSFAICYLYHKPWKQCQTSLFLAMLGTIPLLRYVVLRNHSIIHHFFTHRALLAAWLGFTLGIFYLMKRGRGYEEKEI